jgi:hypothetical protein
MRQAKDITEAVNFLISSTSYTRMIGEITGIIERWDAHPMAYAGKLAFLNCLIDLGVDNREAFEKIITLIEDKRRMAPVTRRQDYQRQLMRDRRARVGKAVEIKELRSGPMTPRQRTLYIKATHNGWMQERKAYLDARPGLSWKDRNAAGQAFWEDLDVRLDDELYALRQRRLADGSAYVQ